MSSFSITISASAVAWYAAIVGTLSMLILAVKAWRDRPRVRVSARGNMKLLGDADDKSYIAITVVNAGHRPATVTAVALKVRGKYDLTAGESTREPVELTEGRSRTYLMDQADFDREYVFPDIRYVFAVDTTGRVWKGKFQPPSPGGDQGAPA